MRWFQKSRPAAVVDGERPAAVLVREEAPVAAPVLLPLNKPCEAEDFDNPALMEVMRRVFSHCVAEKPEWPRGEHMRKFWEVAMAVHSMERLGKIHSDSLVLGVGAGLELTTFYLTNFVRQVYATDLYLAMDSNWTTVAPPAMLVDPASQSPIPCNPRRLVAQHMDGRKLLYEDNTFDVVYSSSSIEHFGDWEDVAMSAREIGRVLKPGGLLTLSTEMRIRGNGRGMPNVLVFSPDEFRSLIVNPSGLMPVDEPTWTISDLTMSKIVTQQEMDEYYTDLNAGRKARWQTFPHIVLSSGEYMWTSYHLALTKPA